MKRVTFNRRPEPLFAEYRPMHKIGEVLLVLGVASRGKQSSLLRLHFFNWALRTEQRRELLKSMREDDEVLDVWGFDPALNNALQIAREESLIVFRDGYYKITERGERFVALVIENDLFQSELLFLKKVGKQVSEALLGRVAGKWK